MIELGDLLPLGRSQNWKMGATEVQRCAMSSAAARRLRQAVRVWRDESVTAWIRLQAFVHVKQPARQETPGALSSHASQ